MNRDTDTGRPAMYGHRARIGYTSPPAATEVFPYEFYRIVPDGVTLALTTLAIMELDADEVNTSYDISLRAARQLARTGIDVMVYGGVPINLSRGVDNVASLIGDTEKDIGIPVTTSITAQLDALKILGAGKVACVHPFDSGTPDSVYDRLFGDYLDANGYDMVGIAGADRPAVDLGRIPAETPLGLARDLKMAHPEADTLYFPCPHWAVADIIEPLEDELGVTVVTALQAIVWDALRRCGVDEPIAGYGRLLREH
jgi:maleate isomerase